MLLELIQTSLDKRDRLSRKLSADDWQGVFEAAINQSVASICLKGMSRLPKEQQPPEELYWEWYGIATKTQFQNEILDKRTADVWKKLHEAGLDAVVLKGQGVAQEYDTLASLRQCGDIDVWVLGGYDKLCEFIQNTIPTDDVAYHRFHYNMFKDVEVELHHRPTLMRNLIDDCKLAKWYNGFTAKDFVYLKDKGFAVPPASFNRIFILTHIYRHFLFEGIGLRQVMDYYYVMHNSECMIQNEAELLKEFRLTRFAGAMMWVLHEVFGLDEGKMICPMNEKEGRFVLDEIILTGNFGQTDKRYRYRHLRKLRQQIAHGTHLLLHYPSEVICTPIWLLYHKIWKWNKKRKIRREWKRKRYL